MENASSSLCLAPARSQDSDENLRPLARLSDDELLSGLRAVVFESRQVLARLILFLAEVDRRRLWEKYASSLFDFCARCLGLRRTPPIDG